MKKTEKNSILLCVPCTSVDSLFSTSPKYNGVDVELLQVEISQDSQFVFVEFKKKPIIIDKGHFSANTYVMLMNMGIRTFDDIKKIGIEKLCRTRHFGEKRITEIYEVCQKMNIDLSSCSDEEDISRDK